MTTRLEPDTRCLQVYRLVAGNPRIIHLRQPILDHVHRVHLSQKRGPGGSVSPGVTEASGENSCSHKDRTTPAKRRMHDRHGDREARARDRKRRERKKEGGRQQENKLQRERERHMGQFRCTYATASLVLMRLVDEMLSAASGGEHIYRDPTGDLIGFTWLADSVVGYRWLCNKGTGGSALDQPLHAFEMDQMARLVFPFGSNTSQCTDYCDRLIQLKGLVGDLGRLGSKVLESQERTVGRALVPVVTDGAQGPSPGIVVMARLIAAVRKGGGLEKWEREWRVKREAEQKRSQTELVRLSIMLLERYKRVAGQGRRRGRAPGEYIPDTCNYDRYLRGVKEVPKAKIDRLRLFVRDPVQSERLMSRVNAFRKRQVDAMLRWEGERWDDICMHRANTRPLSPPECTAPVRGLVSDPPMRRLSARINASETYRC
ncbi:hypothetical protein KIPB_000341 [Kipferlia bialata]|uniref:Uncharacterized protein n=1 Tax=Kipferlia bialata TaxID=797122 RepID=A0A9K3CM72_9EUKA|nr:hypothetical protein KIPB_000341 [Kipferlia bialata]|eukprot:g341.t1